MTAPKQSLVDCYRRLFLAHARVEAAYAAAEALEGERCWQAGKWREAAKRHWRNAGAFYASAHQLYDDAYEVRR